MRKHMLFGMIVLLSLSLFFLGCPTDSSSDVGSEVYTPPPNSSGGPSVTTPGQAGNTLADKLGDISGITVDSNDGNGNITISGTATISEEFSIPPGVIVTVGTGTITTTAPISVASSGGLNVEGTITTTAATTVAAGGALTIATGGTYSSTAATNVANGGSLNIAGDYTVNTTGTIINNGNIAVEGTYTLDGAGGTNNGIVTVKDGGIILSGGAPIDGDGINVVEEGGMVYWNATGTDTPIAGPTGVFRPQSGGSFTYNNGSFVINGEVILNTVGRTPSAWFSLDATPLTGQQLTINKGGKLTISTGSVLNVWNAAARDALIGDLTGTGSDPQIEIVGTISFSSAATQSNFYNSSNAQIIAMPIAADTYTWDAEAGGTTTPGWLAP